MWKSSSGKEGLLKLYVGSHRTRVAEDCNRKKVYNDDIDVDKLELGLYTAVMGDDCTIKVGENAQTFRYFLTRYILHLPS